MNWILNLIGIAVYFITRYANRKTKTTPFRWKFWLKNNGPEFLSTLLLNIALMLILSLSESVVDVEKMLNGILPAWLMLAGKPTASLLLGLGISAGFYKLYKTKIK